MVLADLAVRRLRNTTPQLVEALTGRFREHHALLARMHLNLIDQHKAAIGELTARIEVVIEPFLGFRQLIRSIPGISTLVADVITAETGADMSRFPTAGHLASWAGVCPGHHESAGRIKSTKTRPGNPYPKGALGTAAMAAGRSKDTYLGTRYRRLSSRIGKSKAIVAIEHTHDRSRRALPLVATLPRSGSALPGAPWFPSLGAPAVLTNSCRASISTSQETFPESGMRWSNRSMTVECRRTKTSMFSADTVPALRSPDIRSSYGDLDSA